MSTHECVLVLKIFMKNKYNRNCDSDHLSLMSEQIVEEKNGLIYSKCDYG